MRVTLIASTMVYWHRLPGIGYQPNDYTITGDGLPVLSADELAEFAGRVCHRPNERSATNEAYLNNIICQRHFTVLEHASATFHVADVSRSLTHDLVRHRHLSFSQLSQRYADSRETDYVVPPALRDLPDSAETIGDIFEDAMEAYDELTERLSSYGLARKQAREAARAVLPNCTATELVVSGNVRAWREFIEKRLSPGSDAELQELASEVLRLLTDIAPNSVQDLASRYAPHTVAPPAAG